MRCGRECEVLSVSDPNSRFQIQDSRFKIFKIQDLNSKCHVAGSNYSSYSDSALPVRTFQRSSWNFESGIWNCFISTLVHKLLIRGLITSIAKEN